jgi:hypothetical protein
MSEEQLWALGPGKGQKDKFVAPKEPRDVAKQKAYLTSEGAPYVGGETFMACLIAAGAFVKLDGKRQMSSAKATLLPGFLAIEDAYMLLRHPRKDEAAKWEVDMRQGRNPNGGEAVCCIRPRYDEWCFTVTAALDTDQLAEKVFRELFDLAGSRCGLGDFRPQRRGIFGRFKVACWEVLQEEQLAAE